MKPYGFRPGFNREHEVNERWRPDGWRRSSSLQTVNARRAPRHAERHAAKLEVANLAADTSQCLCEFCDGIPVDNYHFAPWCECDPWDSPDYDACTNCAVRGCGLMAQSMAEAPVVPRFRLSDAIPMVLRVA